MNTVLNDDLAYSSHTKRGKVSVEIRLVIDLLFLTKRGSGHQNRRWAAPSASHPAL